jgi:hypothetical protein
VSVLPTESGEPGKKRFRIAVRVNEEIEGPLRRFSSLEVRAPDADMISSALQKVEEARASGGRPPESTRSGAGLLHAARKAGSDERLESPLEPLLSALIQPPEAPPERTHLSGLLSRIPFSALCSLLELERLTGEVRVRQEETLTTLYVREGRFVDVTSEAGRAPRREIGRLLQSREGKFDLVILPVSREDTIGMSMTQLLLDTAREVDESHRPV